MTVMWTRRWFRWLVYFGVFWSIGAMLRAAGLIG